VVPVCAARLLALQQEGTSQGIDQRMLRSAVDEERSSAATACVSLVLLSLLRTSSRLVHSYSGKRVPRVHDDVEVALVV
jgi:hypothetical protein